MPSAKASAGRRGEPKWKFGMPVLIAGKSYRLSKEPDGQQQWDYGGVPRNDTRRSGSRYGRKFFSSRVARDWPAQPVYSPSVAKRKCRFGYFVNYEEVLRT